MRDVLKAVAAQFAGRVIQAAMAAALALAAAYGVLPQGDVPVVPAPVAAPSR